MRVIAATLCAALAALGFSASVQADDAAPSSSSKLSSKVEQDINQATSIAADKSSSDLDARVRDLEDTRTAIDKQKAPAVSLSVSGWVGEQVQYNMKQ